MTKSPSDLKGRFSGNAIRSASRMSRRFANISTRSRCITKNNRFKMNCANGCGGTRSKRARRGSPDHAARGMGRANEWPFQGRRHGRCPDSQAVGLGSGKRPFRPKRGGTAPSAAARGSDLSGRWGGRTAQSARGKGRRNGRYPTIQRSRLQALGP